MIEITGYRVEDRDAVRHVCFDTGFLGKSLENIIDNREFFLDLATHYFLEVETSGIFIARDSGAVAGYLFLEQDKKKHDGCLERYFPLRVLREIPRFRKFSSRDLRYYLGYFRAWLRRDFGFSDFHEYPAVLHINIAPEHQRKSAGSFLFDAMFKHLAHAQCPGVQLQTTTANESALRFFTRHGFTGLQSRATSMYEPYGIHGVQNVVMGKKLIPPAPHGALL